MSRVKVVLGFIILACALKYLSNVDQVLQANFLTRERFLAVWIILFALLGLYLLSLFRMDRIKQEEYAGFPGQFAPALLLIFSVSLLPGLFGSPLGELDAYVPVAAGSPSAAAPASTTMQVR